MEDFSPPRNDFFSLGPLRITALCVFVCVCVCTHNTHTHIYVCVAKLMTWQQAQKGQGVSGVYLFPQQHMEGNGNSSLPVKPSVSRKHSYLALPAPTACLSFQGSEGARRGGRGAHHFRSQAWGHRLLLRSPRWEDRHPRLLLAGLAASTKQSRRAPASLQGAASYAPPGSSSLIPQLEQASSPFYGEKTANLGRLWKRGFQPEERVKVL